MIQTWRVRHFKTLEQFEAWTRKANWRYQWERVFVANKAYSVEYRRLRVIG